MAEKYRNKEKTFSDLTFNAGVIVEVAARQAALLLLQERARGVRAACRN